MANGNITVIEFSLRWLWLIDQKSLNYHLIWISIAEKNVEKVNDLAGSKFNSTKFKINKNLTQKTAMTMLPVAISQLDTGKNVQSLSKNQDAETVNSYDLTKINTLAHRTCDPT